MRRGGWGLFKQVISMFVACFGLQCHFTDDEPEVQEIIICLRKYLSYDSDPALEN